VSLPYHRAYCPIPFVSMTGGTRSSSCTSVFYFLKPSRTPLPPLHAPASLCASTPSSRAVWHDGCVRGARLLEADGGISRVAEAPGSRKTPSGRRTNSNSRRLRKRPSAAAAPSRERGHAATRWTARAARRRSGSRQRLEPVRVTQSDNLT
jgi:hypothetical protein